MKFTELWHRQQICPTIRICFQTWLRIQMSTTVKMRSNWRTTRSTFWRWMNGSFISTKRIADKIICGPSMPTPQLPIVSTSTFTSGLTRSLFFTNAMATTFWPILETWAVSLKLYSRLALLQLLFSQESYSNRLSSHTSTAFKTKRRYSSN